MQINRHIPIIACTIIISVCIFLSIKLIGTSEKKAAYNAYLILSIKQIIANQGNTKSIESLKKIDALKDVKLIPSYSKNEVSYYWYNASPKVARKFGLSNFPGKPINDFYGFYVTINNTGNAVDFGFHKP